MKENEIQHNFMLLQSCIKSEQTLNTLEKHTKCVKNSQTRYKMLQLRMSYVLSISEDG